MHADRWSAKTWIAALVLDVALCVYFAAVVCSHELRPPPPGPRYAELALPGEIVCGFPYRARLLSTVDVLELAIMTTVDEAAHSSGDDRDVLDDKFYDLCARLQRIHAAYAMCEESAEAVWEVRMPTAYTRERGHN